MPTCDFLLFFSFWNTKCHLSKNVYLFFDTNWVKYNPKAVCSEDNSAWLAE